MGAGQQSGKQLADASVTLAKLASDATTAITNKLPLGGGTMSGPIAMGNQAITGLPPPGAPDSPVRLQDLQANPWKDKCVVATTGNINLTTGGLSPGNIDAGGPALVSGVSRVLAWKQTVPSQNGVYLANSSAWVRAADADEAGDLRAAMIRVEMGALYGDHTFAQNNEIVTLGTDAVNFVDLGAYAPGQPTTANKAMTASTTTSDGNVACPTALAAKPYGSSYISVMINGIGVRLGDGVKTLDCYFSANGGTTAKSFANIAAGDLLYWVGSQAGYQLASATDTLDFHYLV